MSVHIESPLGFTADFPEHTQVLEDSAAGPNTEQYGLLGRRPGHRHQGRHLRRRRAAGQRLGAPDVRVSTWRNGRGPVLTEGELNLPGKAAYAVLVGYTDPPDGAGGSHRGRLGEQPVHRRCGDLALRQP